MRVFRPLVGPLGESPFGFSLFAEMFPRGLPNLRAVLVQESWERLKLLEKVVGENILVITQLQMESADVPPGIAGWCRQARPVVSVGPRAMRSKRTG